MSRHRSSFSRNQRKLDSLLCSKHHSVVVEKVCVSYWMKASSLISLKLQSVKEWRVLAMIICLLRSILKDQGTSKFRSSATSTVIMSTLMKEIAPFRDVTKKSLRKLLLLSPLNLEMRLDKQRYWQHKQWDIITPVQLNSFLTLLQINSTLWRWIPDYRLSIQ